MFAKKYRSQKTLKNYTVVLLRFPTKYLCIVFDCSRDIKPYKYYSISKEHVKDLKELHKQACQLVKMLEKDGIDPDSVDHNPAKTFKEYICDMCINTALASE